MLCPDSSIETKKRNILVSSSEILSKGIDIKCEGPQVQGSMLVTMATEEVLTGTYIYLWPCKLLSSVCTRKRQLVQGSLATQKEAKGTKLWSSLVQLKNNPVSSLMVLEEGRIGQHWQDKTLYYTSVLTHSNSFSFNENIWSSQSK